MGGSSKSQTIGYRYFMSLHMGIGRGPLDEIVAIKVGDLRAWPFVDGSAVVTIAEGPDGSGRRLKKNGVIENTAGTAVVTARENGPVKIEAKDLFGGEQKEGGIEGTMVVQMGQPNQNGRDWFTYCKMTGLIPAFRGVTTVLFNGLICAINPYPKKWSFRVRRVLQGWEGDVWNPSKAVIWMKGGAIKAMNPAHIIYECLTNKAWGRGFSPSFIDDASFTAAANTLYNEGFGLCLKWSRQTELDQFIKIIIDHAGAALNTDRETGLIRLDLIRGDYNPATIPHYDYQNGLLSIEDDEVISQEELINEVIVEWFDPLKGAKREVRAHNLALVQTMGGKTVTKTNYEGIPTADLAARVAQRDLKVSSVPLRRYTLTFDRSAWKITPTSVFSISASDRQLSNIILRAGKVSESRFGDGKITVEAVSDIFGLPSTTYIEEAESEFEAPDRSVTFPIRRNVVEATYADLYAAIDPANFKELDQDSGFLGTLASRPTVLSQSYQLRSRAVGETEWRSGFFAQFAPSVKVIGAVEPMQSTMDFELGVDIGLIKTGMMVTLGDEICRLENISTPDGESGTMTVSRGCVDTIPVAHSAGTIAYFSAVGDKGMDDREYARTETVEVKMQTRTSSGMLDLDDAPTDSLVITARHARPYPPGNVTVDSQSIYQTPVTATGDVNIAWNRRNRKTIKDVLVPHTSGEAGVEPGVKYRLRVYKGSTLVRTELVDGWTFAYTNTMATEDGVTSAVTFRLDAELNGIYSRETYVFTVTRL